MTDFRIEVELKDFEGEQELDWDREKHIWTLSEKEYGLGQQWVQNLIPNSTHLKSLINFFRIQSSVSDDVLVASSPGELTNLHHNDVTKPSVFAVLCEECGEHWHVYRWDENKQQWLIYGRTCDFSWYRGKALSDDQKAELKKIQHVEQ